MPKGSEALTNARREEIIEGCARLYETVSFKEITMKEISTAISLTRASIYNYSRPRKRSSWLCCSGNMSGGPPGWKKQGRP